MSGDKIVFSAESYTRAGRVFSEEAKTFASTAAGILDGMDMGALGCNNGGTLADGAFAVVFPVALEALRDTAAGLGRGFDAVGEALVETAAEYAELEADHAKVAKTVGEVD